MKLGFTGTRKGMSIDQQTWFLGFLRQHYLDIEVFHHGDCKGADDEAHWMVRQVLPSSLPIVIHPPSIATLRAFCSGDLVTILNPEPFMMRNRDIVEACDAMVVMPKTQTAKEEPRSGTWATYRYACNRYGDDVRHHRFTRELYLVRPNLTLEQI